MAACEGPILDPATAALIAGLRTDLAASMSDLAASHAHNTMLKDALADADAAREAMRQRAATAQLEAAAWQAVVAAELNASESDAEHQQHQASTAQLEAAARHAVVALEVRQVEQQAEASLQEAFEARVRGGLMQAELGATERSLADANAAARAARSERLAEGRALAGGGSWAATTTSAAVPLQLASEEDETTGPSGAPIAATCSG
jgi:hypothetical protein